MFFLGGVFDGKSYGWKKMKMSLKWSEFIWICDLADRVLILDLSWKVVKYNFGKVVRAGFNIWINCACFFVCEKLDSEYCKEVFVVVVLF